MTMLTDAIEYDRLRTGQRREGLFVGGFELIQTTSFVVGPLVVGFAFSAAGLVPGQVAAGAQPASAIEMIRIAYSVIPGACCACGILLLCAYRLTRGRLESMRDAAAALPPTGTQALAASGGGVSR
jgi:GPH family glycoside/pentoside/hexuronide:cation symporter